MSNCICPVFDDFAFLGECVGGLVHPKTAGESCPALPLRQGMIFNGLRVPNAGLDLVQAEQASQVVRFALTGEETVALQRLADSESITLNPVWHERDVEFHRRLSYPLTVHAVAEPTLHLALIHDRFTAAEADVLAGHLCTALPRLAGSPHGKVGDLSLLAPAEHTLLTSGGHADPLAHPRERTIPELFDADELWLTDADGARYTAEFRFVAVDRRGPAPEGQS